MDEHLNSMPESVHGTLLDINVLTMMKNNQPAVELRRLVLDTEVMKKLLKCAYYNVPIILRPRFTDKTKSLSHAVQIGILYIDEADGNYKFNI